MDVNIASGDTQRTQAYADLRTVLEDELACIKGEGTQQSIERKRNGKAAVASGAVDAEFLKSRFHYDLWGLGLSGGGIRSATFALGLIQSLAIAKQLPRFHYLSTVSGGGYIGSWLSSWATRHPGGIDGVVDDLNQWPQGKKIEADPLWYLRSYTSYLTPQLGILSADTWTLIATYLRNLLLNSLVLLPLCWALVLTPKIGLTLVRLQHGDAITGFVLENRWWAAVVAFAAGSLCLVFGMTYILSAVVEKLSGEEVAKVENNQAAKVHTQRDFLLKCLVLVMLAAILIPLAWAWYPPEDNPGSPQAWLIWFVLAGIATRLVAWLAAIGLSRLRGRRADPKRPSITAILLASLATGALGGVLFWLVLTSVFSGIAGTAGSPAAGGAAGAFEIANYTCFAPPLLLLSMLTAESVFIGVTSRVIDDEDREWWGRAGGWLLIGSLFWLGLRLVALFGPLSIHLLEAQAPVAVTALGGVSGIVTAVLGFSVRTPGAQGAKAPVTVGGILRGFALTLAAAVFVYTLFACLALAGDHILDLVAASDPRIVPHCNDGNFATWLDRCAGPAAALQQSVGLVLVLAAIVTLVALALVMQVFVSINRFSLHAMYRARLIRAYLGASNPTRHPNWFTGFDPADNLEMANVKVGIHSGDSGQRKRYPLHIVNTALNLVHGKNLAWQQRKAASLTISPLYVGNRDLGYRPSRSYGHPDGISLGTALTISGAAASPNMGYHSSPIIGLVMTLFNCRLGAWLGNPGEAGSRTFNRESPRFSAKWLVYEALGLTDSASPYVYLSDGGHFENLGLYELVQRRCRLIVISDAGCDRDFEFADLGNAIRKIRVDLGVEIVMDSMDMHSRSGVDDHGAEEIHPGRHFATGRIRYPEWQGDESYDGKLIYIKPGIYGHEPRDVLNYAATHPDFPHESTADQWFDESQYESYRRLGQHVGSCLFGGLEENASIDDVFAAARRNPTPTAAAGASAGIITASMQDGADALGAAPVRKLHRRRRSSWFGRPR